MSVSYFVRYDIQAGDIEGFMERYRKVHVPLVARWPGLRRIVLHTPIGWNEPFPVNRGKAVLLAQLEFDDQESLEKAFASRERAAARQDFKRFPSYEGSVTHQAMASEEAWRRKP